MGTNHSLRCACGNVRGHVVLPATTARAVCYCKDCRAFAHYLGHPQDILDAQGGTDIVAAPPSHVRFEHGVGSLACMSLSPRGLLRWYAGCCKTPIGNTPRDRRTHYVGLIRACLAQPLEASFGPARVKLNTASARAPVESARFGAVLAVAKVMAFMLPARFTGRHRDNPFFDAASGEPVRRPEVLSREEASRLKSLP